MRVGPWTILTWYVLCGTVPHFLPLLYLAEVAESAEESAIFSTAEVRKIQYLCGFMGAIGYRISDVRFSLSTTKS